MMASLLSVVVLLLVLAPPPAARGATVYPQFNDVSAHPDVVGGRYALPHISFRSFGNRSRFATRGARR